MNSFLLKKISIAMHGRESNQNKLLDCCVVVRQGQGNWFVARMLYFVVKSLHFLEHKKISPTM